MTEGPLKILWLGNSNDTRASIEEGARRPEIMGAMLEAEIGRPVQVVTRQISPRAELPERVAKWMEEEHPDVVWLYVTRFPFAYESVPLRVHRRFGRGGKKVSGWGVRAGKDPRFANTRLFHWGKLILQHTVGGDAHLPVETVIERMSAAARVVARHESAILILEGPGAQNDYHQGRRAARRAEAKRLRAHEALKALAGELRCSYHGSEAPLRESVGEPNYQADRFHMDEESHVSRAEHGFPALLEAAREGGLDGKT